MITSDDGVRLAIAESAAYHQTVIVHEHEK